MTDTMQEIEALEKNLMADIGAAGDEDAMKRCG